MFEGAIGIEEVQGVKLEGLLSKVSTFSVSMLFCDSVLMFISGSLS